MDWILNALWWVVKGIFKMIWKGIKFLFDVKSDENKAETKDAKNSKKEETMGGLFDHRIPTNWTATYYYRGEHIRVTLHHHKTQPAESEFINEMRKMRGGRINVSEVKLMNIVQG